MRACALSQFKAETEMTTQDTSYSTEPQTSSGNASLIQREL